MYSAGVQFELSVTFQYRPSGEVEIGVQSPGEPSGLNVYTSYPPH